MNLLESVIKTIDAFQFIAFENSKIARLKTTSDQMFSAFIAAIECDFYFFCNAQKHQTSADSDKTCDVILINK